MSKHTRFRHLAAVLALAACALLPSWAAAQAQRAPAQSQKWEYNASIYAWLPSLSGQSKFPVDSGGSSITVDADKLLESLNGVFMGSLGAHNGKWGAFTDVIYFDVGGTKSQSRDFTIGNTGLPANTSADLSLDFKAWIWTLAGEYRVKSDPDLKVDLVGGARLLDLEEKLGWNISGSLGNISAAGRSGSVNPSQSYWDAIIGVKGRYTFGADRKWSMPFYLDVGTGQSDLTWQAAIGVGYSFGWGDLYAMYRHLEYDMKSGKVLESLSVGGPLIGATWRW